MDQSFVVSLSRRNLIVAVALCSIAAIAKRLPPKPVSPVVANGIRYSVDGDGRDEYVAAQDLATGKDLWKVLVFHNRTDPFKEQDVQLVYINELKLMNSTLFVKDERSRCYAVDLATHEVKKQACGASAP